MSTKTKFKAKKRRRKIDIETEELTNSLQSKRVASATNLQASLMELATPAIKFKKRLLNNEMAPDFLRLKNADDILDRTIPKPTQQVNMTGQIMQANLSAREIKELIISKLANKATEVEVE